MARRLLHDHTNLTNQVNVRVGRWDTATGVEALDPAMTAIDRL